MPRTMAFWADGGGVGKTTMTRNSAAALGRDDQRGDVLVIDLDPKKAGLTSRAGFDELLMHPQHNVVEALLNKDRSLRDIVLVGDRNGLDFDLIPAHDDLTSFGEAVTRSNISGNRWTLLRWALEDSGLWNEYEYILIDASKGKGLAAANAIVAMRNVLTPARLNQQGIDEVRGVEGYLMELQQGMERSGTPVTLSLVSVVPNFADGTNSTETALSDLKAEYPTTPFEFRDLVVIDDANDAKMNVFDFVASAETRYVRPRERPEVAKFERLADVIEQGSPDVAEAGGVSA